MRRLVVVGTGTGVGKTHAAVALVRALAAEGQAACGLKPVESGVADLAEDWAALAAAGTFHVKHPPYALRDPVSPHLAARREGIPIRLDRIVSWVDEHAALGIAVIETAGGLLSPLTARATNLDLAVRLRPDAVVLVGRDRLGVLHDVRACRLALDARLPRKPLCVVLQPPDEPDASTGTNAGELARLRLARRVITFPHAPAGSPAVLDAARAVLGHLARRRE